MAALTTVLARRLWIRDVGYRNTRLGEGLAHDDDLLICGASRSQYTRPSLGGPGSHSTSYRRSCPPHVGRGGGSVPLDCLPSRESCDDGDMVPAPEVVVPGRSPSQTRTSCVPRGGHVPLGLFRRIEAGVSAGGFTGRGPPSAISCQLFRSVVLHRVRDHEGGRCPVPIGSARPTGARHGTPSRSVSCLNSFHAPRARYRSQHARPSHPVGLSLDSSQGDHVPPDERSPSAVAPRVSGRSP